MNEACRVAAANTPSGHKHEIHQIRNGRQPEVLGHTRSLSSAGTIAVFELSVNL